MKYYVIRSVYNRIIDAESDIEALIRAKQICTNPSDHVFVVKESGIVNISKEDFNEFIKPIMEEVKKEFADNMAEDEITDDVSKSSK